VTIPFLDRNDVRIQTITQHFVVVEKLERWWGRRGLALPVPIHRFGLVKEGGGRIEETCGQAPFSSCFCRFCGKRQTRRCRPESAQEEEPKHRLEEEEEEEEEEYVRQD